MKKRISESVSNFEIWPIQSYIVNLIIEICSFFIFISISYERDQDTNIQSKCIIITIITKYEHGTRSSKSLSQFIASVY